jgi:hypothetical protein
MTTRSQNKHVAHDWETGIIPKAAALFGRAVMIVAVLSRRVLASRFLAVCRPHAPSAANRVLGEAERRDWAKQTAVTSCYIGQECLAGRV